MFSGYAEDNHDIDTYPLHDGGIRLLVDVDYTDKLALIWFPMDATTTFVVGGFTLNMAYEEVVNELKKAFISAAQIVQEEQRR